MTGKKPPLTFGKMPAAAPVLAVDEATAQAFIAREGRASAVGQPATTEKKARLTVYIPRDLDKRLRHAIVDDGADLSEAVKKALELWLQSLAR